MLPSEESPSDDTTDSSKSKEAEEEEQFYVSQLGRNRLTSACDLLAYMRYVERGLVKATANEVYWEIMRLRKNVVLARMGFGLPEHD